MLCCRQVEAEACTSISLIKSIHLLELIEAQVSSFGLLDARSAELLAALAELPLMFFSSRRRLGFLCGSSQEVLREHYGGVNRAIGPVVHSRG
jgi:hypothetical protein